MGEGTESKMQPPTQESLASWLNSKSKNKTFFDSPGAMEHANYQVLTPLSGTSFTSFQTGGTPGSANVAMHDDGSLNKILETAQKKRTEATEALDSVTKALKPRDNIVPYVRISPGHFLLPTTTAPPSHLKSSKQQLALGSPFSATRPGRGASRFSPGDSTRRTGDVVENLAATLKSLGGGGGGGNTSTPASAPSLRRITSSPMPSSMVTPLSSSSRLGRISGAKTTAISTPGSRGMPSSVNYINNSRTTMTTLPMPMPTTTAPTTSTASHRLSELQKHHTDLLAACHEAESAATKAKYERKKAQEDLKNATTKLQHVETSLQEKQKKMEEMTSAQHAQQAILDATIEKLATYQAQVTEIAEKMEFAKKETLDFELKLKSLKEEWDIAQSQAVALQTDASEAQHMSQIHEELQKQVDMATAKLESLTRRQSHAENAALEAEKYYIAASSALQELEFSVKQRNEELVSTEALATEAEALLEEKEARAAEAQQQWEAAEERLGAIDSALVEVTARLEAKRQLVSETEQRCEVLERELRCAEEYTRLATTAAEEAERELSRIVLSVEAARADESMALEEATEAEARAAVACELADAEEQRAEEVAAVVARLEERWQKVEAAEQRLIELQAEIGEAEAILVIQSQLVVAIDERDALLDELESAQEYGALAAAEAQRAQQLGEDVEAKMQSTLAQSEALILELEVKLEAARLAETEQQKARVEAETLATNALAEVERLTHSHFSINEVKLLEAELHETRAQLTRAADAAETAAERASLAEKQVDCADNQLTLALVERDAALDKLESVSKARDTAVAEIAELKKEAAHREAAFEELNQHQNQMESVLRTLKQDRGEAQALAEALNLQVEALQDRLRAETGRRVMLEQVRSSSGRVAGFAAKKTNSSASSPGATTAAPEVERLLAQNATLKATATRLSKALAVALQRPSSGKSSTSGGSENDDHEDCIPALHSPQKSHREQQHPWNNTSTNNSFSVSKRADLHAVLEQLEAVESLLSSPQ
jgi:hypothetical protein